MASLKHYSVLARHIEYLESGIDPFEKNQKFELVKQMEDLETFINFNFNSLGDDIGFISGVFYAMCRLYNKDEEKLHEWYTKLSVRDRAILNFLKNKCFNETGTVICLVNKNNPGDPCEMLFTAILEGNPKMVQYRSWVLGYDDVSLEECLDALVLLDIDTRDERYELAVYYFLEGCSFHPVDEILSEAFFGKAPNYIMQVLEENVDSIWYSDLASNALRICLKYENLQAAKLIRDTYGI